ncbi:MAG: hypothetical protein K0U16_07470 [Gammaproteobacteria bacterium]|nr:hypothetical protein [Gammaproteobacteria bacterium]
MRQMTHADNVADAAFLEAQINRLADERGIPEISREDALAANALAAAPRSRQTSRLDPDQAEAIASQHFSF